MEAVKTQKTVKIYGDELEKVHKKIRVETINYNCIDVRAFRDDGDTWVFIADLQPFFDKHINGVFLVAPETEKRNYKREQLQNSGLERKGNPSANVLREEYFLQISSVRKKDQKAFVCYQCGGEIQQGPTVKRGFSVCHDGRTERRIARFHYMCFEG